jgi:hypothetical protein
MLGEHDADMLRRRTKLRLLLRVKTDRADHHVHAQPAANIEVMQRAFGRVKSISTSRLTVQLPHLH